MTRRKAPSGRLRRTWVILTSLLLWSTSQAEEIYKPHCREALGMHSGLIPESSITASSSYDTRNVGPQNSRIRTESYGGAWCPKPQIAHDIYEWLEVDLGEIREVTLVETQGRFGNGQGQEYAEHYMLEYQRTENGRWIRYRNRQDEEVWTLNIMPADDPATKAPGHLQLFAGNQNTYIAELREVNPPIIARKVRFVPYSRHQRTICMRVELYGCDWKEGVVSYSMPQGHVRGSELNLFDFTYDGLIKNDYLSGGLGQLVDGEEGYSNFRLDNQGIGKKGYEWVGWRNDSSTEPVSIIFEFDQVRNFSSVRVFCNNMYMKSIRIFSMAKLYFSMDGKNFKDVVSLPILKDSLVEYARPIVIPIPHRIGQYVKMDLYFEARWIMIAEVDFKSEIVNMTLLNEPPPTTLNVIPTTPVFAKATMPPVPIDTEDESKLEEKPYIVEIEPSLKDRLAEAPYRTESDQEDNTQPPGGETMHQPDRHDDVLQEEHIGIIIGALAALILLLFAVSIFIIIRNRRKKKEEANTFGPYEKQHMTTGDVEDFKFANGMLGSYHMYNSIGVTEGDYDEDSFKKAKAKESALESEKLMKGEDTEPTADTPPPLYVKLPPEPVYQQNLQNAVREGSPNPPTPPPKVFNPTPRNLAAAKVPPPTVPPPPIPPPPHPNALVKALDFVPIGNEPGTSGAPKSMENDLIEFPRQQLKFVEKIGEGQFGEVHRCMARLCPDGKTFQDIPVAIKLLRDSADKITREHFLQEAKVLAGLKDPNMAQVLGVCSEADPILMVLEYTKYGDLNALLHQYVNEDDAAMGGRPMSYGCQIYMATQIASGMKFLESLNLVHRDLATRNCLVDEDYIVKINDLGMSHARYAADYYRIEGRATLPIRWMAWESVMLGKFSGKSDVWAFAVTLWEIMTLGRETPFADFTAEEIIDNCNRFFHGDEHAVVLPLPRACPKEIYDLMLECWSQNEAHRPSFREIHMFLQRKNMGYNPRQDRVLNMQATA